jgi:hypothetical protein
MPPKQLDEEEHWSLIHHHELHHQIDRARDIEFAQLKEQLQAAYNEIKRLREELSEYIQKEPEAEYVDRDVMV